MDLTKEYRSRVNTFKYANRLTGFMEDKKHRVCPVERAGSLDNFFRRLYQNPKRILKEFISEGMTVLDIGCGPGVYTLEMAKLVGKTGKVIAVDLQEGMLKKVESKIKGTEFEKRITLHKCEATRLGIFDKIDFALAFYVVHEVPDQSILFKEVASLLKPKGKLYVIEPKFHVTKKEFDKTISYAKKAGLKPIKKKWVFISRSIILQN